MDFSSQHTNSIFLEFIHMIASEANEAVIQTSKKTIGPEHVLMAIKNLGFEDYLDEVTATLNEHKEETKNQKARMLQKTNSGISEEEMIRAQMELFAKARANYNPSNCISEEKSESMD
eukprot:Sdes_comp19494_c0_seq1m11010